VYVLLYDGCRLESRGLSTKGKKAELADRLTEAIATTLDVVEPAEEDDATPKEWKEGVCEINWNDEWYAGKITLVTSKHVTIM
jgi:hypothetical protein